MSAPTSARGRHEVKRTRGFAAILMVCVLAGCVLLLVAMEGASTARAAQRRSERDRSDYVATAQAKVSEWYFTHAAAIDDPGRRSPIENEVMQGARLVPRWGVRVAVSELLGDDALRYRRIALWLPTRERSGAAFALDGTFDATLGSPFAVVDGRAIETALRDRTLGTLQRLARALEGRFRARALADSDHRVDVNHFRPRDPACAADADELPCLDVFTDAAGAGLARIAGVGDNELRSAWGGPVELSNGSDGSADGPPFRLRLRSRTPWGSYVEVVALQSLD